MGLTAWAIVLHLTNGYAVVLEERYTSRFSCERSAEYVVRELAVLDVIVFASCEPHS